MRCMRAALDEGGVAPEQVGAVYASANGSVDFDRLEAQAIAEVFGGRAVRTTSVKGAVGEGGMAGAASLVTAVLAGRSRRRRANGRADRSRSVLRCRSGG